MSRPLIRTCRPLQCLFEWPDQGHAQLVPCQGHQGSRRIDESSCIGRRRVGQGATGTSTTRGQRRGRFRGEGFQSTLVGPYGSSGGQGVCFRFEGQPDGTKGARTAHMEGGEQGGDLRKDNESEYPGSEEESAHLQVEGAAHAGHPGCKSGLVIRLARPEYPD